MELGFLRTVGMTRSQVSRQVLLEAIILGLVGSILGIGFGYLLARGLTKLLGSVLDEELNIPSDPTRDSGGKSDIRRECNINCCHHSCLAGW